MKNIYQILVRVCILIAICNSSAIAQGKSESIINDPIKYDEYGYLPSKREKLRLDQLAEQLKSNSDAKAYLVVYNGRNDRADRSLTVACRSRTYLINRHKIAPKRVIGMAISGRYRNKLSVELWIFPIDVPDDSQGITDLNVNSKDVQIIKNCNVRNNHSSSRLPRKPHQPCQYVRIFNLALPCIAD